MNRLSENNIKRVSLSFLKSYYRYRPRTGKTTLQLNMRGAGGIIVDGYLSFPQEEGPDFIATVESTSYMTRDEVRYQLHHSRITWDGVAVSLLVLAVALGTAHVTQLISIPVMGGWLLWLLGLAFTAFLLTMAYRLLFRGWRRYRYIYAVEQFKRYHADEQWIAIGEDVFPSSEDPYFRELREQCIFNGFGLIVVDQDLRCKVHITPSRTDLFSRRREAIEFFSLDELTRRLEQTVQKTGLRSRLGRFLPVSGRPAAGELQRYRPQHTHQLLVSLIAGLLIGAIFFLEMEEEPVRVVDEATYQEQVTRRQQSTAEEPEGYLLDSAALRPFEQETESYLESEAPAPAAAEPPKAGDRPGLIVYEARNRFFEYDCERLYAGVQPGFVIAVEIFDSPGPLKQLIGRFQQKGLDAMGLWLGCFDGGEDDYVLFLAQLYATRAEAAADLPAWQQRIEDEGFSTRLEVIALQQNE